MTARISFSRFSLLFSLPLLVLSLSSCHSPNRESGALRPGRSVHLQGKAQGKGYTILATTPVKDQGKSESCWIYAYLACIETERTEQYGDSLNLSPQWLERAFLKEQARQSYLTQGQWQVNMRNVGPEAERLLQDYGMVTYGNFCPKNMNTRVVARDIYNKVKLAVNAKTGLSRLEANVEESLPHLPHNLREGFYLYGMHYTPQQFAQSILYGVRFRWLTSYTHHPYGSQFVLEIPDNRSHHTFNNVTIKQFLKAALQALRHRHPVYWEGDMRPVTDHDIAIAVDSSGIITSDINAIAEARQRAFERFSTTDQHAMAIVGITYLTPRSSNATASDPSAERQPYFICKNSWGKHWQDNGFTLMSLRHFLLRTTFVGIP